MIKKHQSGIEVKINLPHSKFNGMLGTIVMIYPTHNPEIFTYAVRLETGREIICHYDHLEPTGINNYE